MPNLREQGLKGNSPKHMIIHQIVDVIFKWLDRAWKVRPGKVFGSILYWSH